MFVIGEKYYVDWENCKLWNEVMVMLNECLWLVVYL